MPLIWMEFNKGRTVEQKREFAERVTDACVEALGAERENVRLRFIEVDESEVAKAGKYPAG